MVDSVLDAFADRYSRQTRFAFIGEAGQRKLADASVLIVGVGALGASLAQHMVRAGVGEVRLVDRDFVEPSNLQRQMLFDEADALAVMPKAVAAANRLRQINSSVNIMATVADVNAQNIGFLAGGVHLVLDGTDNAATRLLVSDQCFRQRIPFVYGGVAGAQGMQATLIPGETSCLRCLIGADDMEQEADTCDTVGVLAPAVEWIASMQAAEAIKWLTGNDSALRKTWLSIDLWSFRMRESELPAFSTECPFCAQTPEVAIDGMLCFEADRAENTQISSTVLCGRDTVQVTLGKPFDLKEVEQTLRALGCTLTVNRYLVKAMISSGEQLILFPDGRVLVQGTADAENAINLVKTFL